MDNTINRVDAVTDAIPDTGIIRRVLAGEKNLYAILIRRYNQRLYRVAMAIINDDTAVEDVMQVAYIKAYENLERFQHRSAFSTWLTRILINECLQLKKRKQTLPINDEFMGNEIHSHLADTKTPLIAVMNNELKTILENAISLLPEKYKTVYIMRELEEMTVAETGESLDLSEANVKIRLNRARVMLRKWLTAAYKKEDLFGFHLSRCDRMVQRVMREVAPIKLNTQAN